MVSKQMELLEQEYQIQVLYSGMVMLRTTCQIGAATTVCTLLCIAVDTREIDVARFSVASMLNRQDLMRSLSTKVNITFFIRGSTTDIKLRMATIAPMDIIASTYANSWMLLRLRR